MDGRFLGTVPRTLEALKEYLEKHPNLSPIVWHRGDGDEFWVHRRDLGLPKCPYCGHLNHGTAGYERPCRRCRCEGGH
jgi:hypothetical protein